MQSGKPFHTVTISLGASLLKRSCGERFGATGRRFQISNLTLQGKGFTEPSSLRRGSPCPDPKVLAEGAFNVARLCGTFPMRCFLGQRTAAVSGFPA